MICLQKMSPKHTCSVQHNDITVLRMTELLHEKKHAETIGCFGHMFNDVISAELALVPFSKLYYWTGNQ